MKKKPDTLTRKEELFVEHYVYSRDLEAAWLHAGYFITKQADKSRYHKIFAARVLKRPRVKKRYDEILANARKKMGLSIEWVVEEYMDLYKRAKEAQDLGTAKQTLDSLGKYLGMFVDKKISVNQNIDATNMDDLDREIARLASVAGINIHTTEKLN